MMVMMISSPHDFANCSSQFRVCLFIMHHYFDQVLKTSFIVNGMAELET